MEKLKLENRHTIFKPGESRLPPALEELPAWLRKQVIWIEKIYTDLVGRINWLMTNVVQDHIADDTLTEHETGIVHSNLGATGAITLTLPIVDKAGIKFTFAVQAAQELRIDPGAATIRDNSGQTADKYKTANAIGESLRIISNSAGDWYTISKNGTWGEEA